MLPLESTQTSKYCWHCSATLLLFAVFYIFSLALLHLILFRGYLYHVLVFMLWTLPVQTWDRREEQRLRQAACKAQKQEDDEVAAKNFNTRSTRTLFRSTMNKPRGLLSLVGFERRWSRQFNFFYETSYNNFATFTVTAGWLQKSARFCYKHESISRVGIIMSG